MPRIERPDLQRRLPVPGYVKIVAILFVIFGIWFQTCTQKQLENEIRFSNLRITEYTRVYLEVRYTITNLSAYDRDANLMLKVYSEKGDLVASTIYAVNVPAHTSQDMIKIIEKMLRPLDKEEKPGKVTLEIYERRSI